MYHTPALGRSDASKPHKVPHHGRLCVVSCTRYSSGLIPMSVEHPRGIFASWTENSVVSCRTVSVQNRCIRCVRDICRTRLSINRALSPAQFPTGAPSAMHPFVIWTTKNALLGTAAVYGVANRWRPGQLMLQESECAATKGTLYMSGFMHQPPYDCLSRLPLPHRIVSNGMACYGECVANYL